MDNLQLNREVKIIIIFSMCIKVHMGAPDCGSL